MPDFEIDTVLARVAEYTQTLPTPVVDEMGTHGAGPFAVLITTLISLRTKDAVTAAAASRLLALARTPEEMVTLDEATIAQAIYPAGFYQSKAATIRRVCQLLIECHGGQVPADLDALLALPGVGRKTANLTLTAGFGLPGICVDTHVHRITNRWGYVHTRTPDETEMALRARLPPRHWIPINGLLVAFGQHLCLPVSPRCSTCPVAHWCARVGVTRSR